MALSIWSGDDSCVRCEGRGWGPGDGSSRPSVTASMLRRDRASQVCLCHGLLAVSSRCALPLRPRGHPASPEDLPPLQWPLCDLRPLWPRPGLLLRDLSRGRADWFGAGRAPPASAERRRPPRPSRSSTRLSRPR